MFHSVQQVINMFQINDYCGYRDELFIEMVVWCAQILCFSRTLKEMQRPDVEGHEPRGWSQLISYNVCHLVCKIHHSTYPAHTISPSVSVF